MILAILFSVIAGAFGVWQAGMNKVVADSLGFTFSLLFNGCFFLLFNLLFFMIVYVKPQAFSSEFAIKFALNEFKWWWVVPGLMGFILVMGLAVSVGRIGAVKTIVISIAAQIIASILWDVFQGGQPIHNLRLIGAGITLLGAIVATLS